MEEWEEIVLKSMERYGVVIPPTVSSVPKLTPTGFLSISAQCLNLIHDTPSFPTSLPSDSVADRVRICSEIASAVKNLGYVGDISFHKLKTEYICCLRQFLYPSEEDLYKLIRFLAERISESSESGRAAELREDNLRSSCVDSTEKADNDGVVCDYSKDETKLNDLRLEMLAPETVSTKADTSINQANKTSKEKDETAAADESSSSMAEFSKYELNCILNGKDLAKGQVDAGSGSFGNEETAAPAHVVDGNMTVLKQKEKVLIDELNEQLQAKRHYLLKLESEWDAVRKPLEERKRSLEDSLFSNNPGAQEMLQKLRGRRNIKNFLLILRSSQNCHP